MTGEARKQEDLPPPGVQRTPGSSLLRKHVAIPQQHGTWALWLAPFAVGVGVGGRPDTGLLWLAVALTGGFLFLQPLTILVKIASGRRGRSDLRVALFWLAVWALPAAAGCAGLLLAGHGSILLLALPALPVLAWQMWLVARRAERRRMLAEIVAAGVLTLAAPAACLASGGDATTGWWLWLLCWLQAGGSIVYVYLRLEQRMLQAPPAWRQRARRSAHTLTSHAANLSLVAAVAWAGWIPKAATVPFAVLLLEAVYGAWLRPATGQRPTAIGIRQTLIHALFALLLIFAWRTA